MTTATAERKTTFKHLANMIEREAEKRKTEARFYIENGFLKSWGGEYAKNDKGIKNNSTGKRWEQYQSGEITREKAVEFATKRRLKEIDRETIKKQDKLLKAQSAAELKSVSVSVSWKRSAYWGYNPTATVTINGIQQYSGTASGCGYDKETAAVGSALNQSETILKALYTAKEKALSKAPAKTRNNPKASNADLIHYGAGYGVLPYFEGGVGMTSFKGVFEACGLKCTHSDHTKTSDYYYFEAGAKK